MYTVESLSATMPQWSTSRREVALDFCRKHAGYRVLADYGRRVIAVHPVGGQCRENEALPHTQTY